MKKNSKGGSKALPHRVGDMVMAKFPGAASLWYKAEITHNTGVYKVQFEDGTKHELAPSAVQSMDAYRTRSPTRSRSPGRPIGIKKSSPRKTSPGRTRGSRSGSPSRRSPSRSRRSSKSPARLKQAVASTSAQADDVAPVRQSERVRKTEERNAAAAAAAAAAAERVETLDSGDVLRRRGGEDRGSRSPAHVAALQTARVATVAAPDVMLRGSNNLLHDGAELSHDYGKKGELHFGGGFGSFLFTFLAPAFVVAINIMCTKQRCVIQEMPDIPTDLCKYVDGIAVAIFAGWVLFQAFLSMLPIGRLVYGSQLADGERLTYRMNGLLSFFLSMAAIGGLLYYRRDYVDVVYSRVFPMMLASILFSLLLSIGFFVRSLYVDARHLSVAGSGGYFYGFFMGRELNPRFGRFDVKFFLEMRPGLIGWAALNVIFIVKEYQTFDFLNHNLLMLAAFQIIYVADALLFEESILTTMDITTEGLGFMLTFGNLTFVPFLFSFPSRFLLEHPNRYPWYYLAAIALLFLVGYIIFRMSNMQKDKFRRCPNDPSIAAWRSIQTGQCKQILVDGWWRHLRHPNYLGDLIMALSWSLLIGNTHVLPHVYFAYLFLLLVHRTIRDNSVCANKYGRAWDEYRRQVPSALFPKIF